MGQTCATDSTVDVAPPPRSRRYTAGGETANPPPPQSPPPEGSPPRAATKMKKIRSMEHRSVSRYEFVERSWYAPTFREFIGLTNASLQAVLAMDVDHAGDRITERANVLVTAGEDRNIYVVNYATGHILSTLPQVHEKDINALQLDRTASTVFSASRDKLIKATNIESGVSQSYQGHALNVTSIHLNPANTTLVSGSRDNSVRLWDVETGSLISTADVKLNVVHFVRWLRGDFDSVVVQGGEDLTVRLWDTRAAAVADGEGDSSKGVLALSQRSVFSNFDYHPTCVELCPENSWRVWTGHNGFNAQGSMVTEWDIRTGKQVRQFLGHSYTIRSIKLLSSAHGRNLLFSASDDMHLSTWNVSPLGEEELVSIPVIDKNAVHTPPYREGAITSITEDGDGNILLSTRSQSVVVLRTSSGKLGMRHRYVGSPIIP